MSYLKAQDTISGAEGRAYTTIDGSNEEMFYAKKIEAKIEKKKAEVKTLGNRGTQSKATGYKGTGTMSIYYVTALYRNMMLDYMENGTDTYFKLQVINDDPNSDVGKQTAVIKNVNIDSVTMALLDNGADVLEEEVSFTFDDVEYLDEFETPTLG